MFIKLLSIRTGHQVQVCNSFFLRILLKLCCVLMSTSEIKIADCLVPSAPAPKFAHCRGTGTGTGTNTLMKKFSDSLKKKDKFSYILNLFYQVITIAKLLKGLFYRLSVSIIQRRAFSLMKPLKLFIFK